MIKQGISGMFRMFIKECAHVILNRRGCLRRIPGIFGRGGCHQGLSVQLKCSMAGRFVLT